MKAAVLRAIHEPPRVEEIGIDPPKRGEALVRVEASGVCHSDLHRIHGALPVEHEGRPRVTKIIGLLAVVLGVVVALGGIR